MSVHPWDLGRAGTPLHLALVFTGYSLQPIRHFWEVVRVMKEIVLVPIAKGQLFVGKAFSSLCSEALGRMFEYEK